MKTPDQKRILQPAPYFLILAAIFLISLVACSSNTEETSKEIKPAGEITKAEELFESKCSICHFSNKAKVKKRSKEEWESTVMRMKKKKPSNMTDEEARIIIDYLAEAYGK